MSKFIIMSDKPMNTLLENQAQVMLELQSKMNSKVASDWLSQRFPYLRAVTIEAAEAIEHHGWKWWKKQECDLPQLQMEVVDIWHFILSQLLIETENDIGKATAHLMSATTAPQALVQFDGQQYDLKELDLLAKLELLIGISVARRIEIDLFIRIMLDCDMSWNTLFEQYVSKNVLNFFRQDNGYKEGHYRKLWNGREDNEHLVEAMEQLDAGAAEFALQLYSELAQRYARSA
jgi:dimeric dUTPase (all-alpha-NTP-PPase superfamily)